MKNDLDALMLERDLEAILITGPGKHNPAMVYMTGGCQLTNADVIKKRGQTPVLFHYPMERDEAAKSGLETVNLGKYDMNRLMKESGGDVLKATVKRYATMLGEFGITSGKVALYGRADIGSSYEIFSSLQQELPVIQLLGELNNSALMLARMTKDAAEAERIRKMGQVTTRVVGQVADFITSHKARDGVMLNSSGEALTIGEVKAHIDLWLAELGAENPEGTIFAIGKDAGVPHSSGNADDPLKLGQTIVFDIYPCEAGGGYFYDFTRTWCLGYAPEAVQAIYQDVLAAYREIIPQLEAGQPFSRYQDMTCAFFNSRGHATIKENPQTEAGYVHSLGHGIGLNIHERPSSGASSDENDRLLPGTVFTIEPGLYYPEKGMGVRLEDSLWVRPDGSMEILADYPMDLVLPVKSG